VFWRYLLIVFQVVLRPKTIDGTGLKYRRFWRQPLAKPTADIPKALWPINYEAVGVLREQSRRLVAEERRETHTNLVIRPPSYLRRMARGISIDSQIKPIRNADRTGDK
jgi:hypothetical protein